MTESSDLDPDRWSVLVLSRHLTDQEQDDVRRYLRRGGAIMTWTPYADFLIQGEAESRLISYLLADRIPWDTISLLDIERNCDIPPGANSLPDQEGRSSAFVGRIDGGSAVVYPFDPADLLADHRSTVRRFHSSKERLPFEQVSTVSKGDLRRLISRSLEYLHHTRGIPYAHLWHYPEDNQSLFGFRIDTDGAPRQDIEDMRDLARQYQIPVTWYIDVQSHESLFPLFREMETDEISLHCYEHHQFGSQEELSRDIRRGKVLLEQAEMSPKGFAAPYGNWNIGIGRAIVNEGFVYSSEFSFAYDTLPIQPELDEGSSGVLQVPVHPICIGSMLRVGYSEEQMIRYFRGSLRVKLEKREPLFYYHHPAQRCWGVLESLFRSVNEQGIAKTTLLDYALWWKKREAAVMVADVEDDGISIQIKGDRSVRARVVMPDGSERFMSRSEEHLSSGVGQWTPVPRTGPIDRIERIREPDMRTFIARWYNHFLRRVQ
ncbi:MAG: hypothetical protein OEV30_08455 [Ignavibacteria bacterium]|nr:hypothetical protein [Ignavibacteria bacterium]